MTTTHQSPLVDGPYATYNLRMTSIYGREQCELQDLTNNISADISMNSQMIEEVTSFKNLGATLYREGTSSAEVHIMIASAIAATTRLNRIWWCNTISFASKFKLDKFLVTSILLYGCETWTLLAD